MCGRIQNSSRDQYIELENAVIFDGGVHAKGTASKEGHTGRNMKEEIQRQDFCRSVSRKYKQIRDTGEHD